MALDPLLHPRGPHPSGVYWRRRLFLLLLVAIVIAVVAYSCSGDGGGGDAKVGTSPAPAVSTTSASPKPRASRTTAAPGRTSASPTATATTPPAPKPCADKDIEVNATADSETYPAGALPAITLAVVNSSGIACTRDIGGGAAELRVLSGADQVWSSDHCTTDKGSKVVTLQPGQRVVAARARWNRHRSRPGCPAGTPEAAAGTYRAVGRLGGAVQVGDSFKLT
jgi:hypothetical protein